MLTLRVLGGLTLQSEVPLEGAAGQRRRLLVLALIDACGPRGTSRDLLQALLWPESTGDRARQALSQALHSLRKDLGISDVVLGSAQLTLNRERVTTDRESFEDALGVRNYEEAIHLYAGAFLEGVPCDSPELEEWVSERRTELRQHYGTALRSACEAALLARQWDKATEFATRLLGLDPYDGSAVEVLCASYIGRGAHAEAVRTIGRLEMRLKEDLSLPLSQKLQQVRKRLLAGNVVPELEEQGVVTTHAVPPKSQPLSPASPSPNRRRLSLRILAAVLASGLLMGIYTDSLRFHNWMRFEKALAPRYLVWSLAAEFPWQDNRGNGWALGSRKDLNSPFRLFHARQSFHGDTLLAWSANKASMNPSILFNRSDTVSYRGWGELMVSREVTLLPGFSGEYSDVRWVVPRSGNMTVSAYWQDGANLAAATTDLHILLNSIGIFTGRLNDSLVSVSDAFCRSLLRGDTLEFLVGSYDRRVDSDHTVLFVTIQRPGPACPSEEIQKARVDD